MKKVSMNKTMVIMLGIGLFAIELFMLPASVAQAEPISNSSLSQPSETNPFSVNQTDIFVGLPSHINECASINITNSITGAFYADRTIYINENKTDEFMLHEVGHCVFSNYTLNRDFVSNYSSFCNDTIRPYSVSECEALLFNVYVDYTMDDLAWSQNVTPLCEFFKGVLDENFSRCI